MHELLFPEKKVKIIACLLLPLMLLLAGAGCFCLERAAEHRMRRREPVEIKIYAVGSDENRQLIFSDAEGVYAPQSAEALLICNESYREGRVSFPHNEELGEVILGGGESQRIPLTSGALPGYFKIQSGDRIGYFVSDADSLREALQSSEAFFDVVFLTDIQSDTSIEFGSSCRIDTGKFALVSEDGLFFRSEEQRELILLSQRENVLTLYARAPRSTLYADKGALSYSEEVADYYLKLFRFNGQGMDARRYPVNSEKMLLDLACGKVVAEESDAQIIFCAPVIIHEDIAFDRVYSLFFQCAPDFAGHTLSFSTEEEKEIRITTQAAVNSAFLKINAPRCELKWQGESVPEIQTLCETIEAKSINNEDPGEYRLGGDSEAQLTSFVVHNENLTHPIEFTLKDNILTGVLDYQDRFFDLEKSSVELHCEGGEVSFNEEIINPDGTLDLTRRAVITLTDSEGKMSRYLIKAVREYKDLPVIEIMTEDRAEVVSKREYIGATIRIEGNGSGFDSLDTTKIQIRGRGNSTWKWEKKPYKLKFSEDLSLFGLAPSNEWILVANYADKSLMRNRLAYEMAKLMRFDYSPTQYCVDLFVNGEYQGVYTFGEHLEAAEGRVELDQSYDPKASGYFIEVGGVNSEVDVKGVNYFHAGTIRFALIKSPKLGKLTSQQFDYISSYMIKADSAVVKGTNWRDYLDEDTLIDWILLMELSNNTDGAFRRSCYYVKNADTKLMMGPVWDFDLAFGNFNRDKKYYDAWATTTDDDYVGVTWTAYLLQDREFVRALYERWNEIRDPLLERAFEVIDDTAVTLAASAEENFKRWDTLNIRTTMQRSDVINYNTHPLQLQYLKTFLTNRAAWMDKEITRLYEGGKYEIPVIEKD